MERLELEAHLRVNGFSEKDIAFMNYWSHKEKVGLNEIIKQVNRVFLGVIFFLLFLTAVAVFEFLTSGNYFGFFIGYSFCVAIFLFFTPMRLGVKVYYYSRKYKVHSL